MLFNFTSLSSIYYLVKLENAFFKFAFIPYGGSFVNFIHLSKIPIGIEVLG